MHDPLVVAWEIPSPFPRRVKWRDGKGRRWGFDVSRRTNTEDRGKRTYRWWRPRGYTLRLAGRAYGLGRLACIWHVEPGGADAFEVCKRSSHWKWHVHHWRIQVYLLGHLKRFLLERCIECGLRYPWKYAPVSHQWESPRTRWRDGTVKRNYHHPCSTLVTTRRDLAMSMSTLASLAAMARVALDESEEEFIARLHQTPAAEAPELSRFQLEKALGWEFDPDPGDGYWLKHADGRRFQPYELLRSTGQLPRHRDRQETT